MVFSKPVRLNEISLVANSFSQDSPFCEVLGREQRAWLQRELDTSTASLRLIVSGSVMFGRPVRSSLFITKSAVNYNEIPCMIFDSSVVC